MIPRICSYAPVCLLALAIASSAAAQKPTKLTKLITEDTKVGKGAPVGPGDTVYVSYVGTFANGTVFDRNDTKGGMPLSFVLGLNPPRVIKGWDLGIRGMKVGGVRKLKIPSDLGYGPQGDGKIPGGSDLYFDVTLLDAIKQGDEGAYDAIDLKVGTGRGAKKGDQLTVEYVGTLVNGKVIDSTYVRKTPVQFTLGVGQAIDGIDIGLIGMKVGGKRRLRLPPALGPAGSAFVPPGSIVIYEIVLKKLSPGK